MAENLQGSFLVSSPQLRDPNFHRTVVLMLEDNDEGSMGLVINRPSSISVDSAFSKVDKKVLSPDPIYSGGPVETTALFILHNCRELGKDEERVAEEIFLTGSNDSFEALVNNELACSHECGFRVYCGYAGWSPEQLQGEISRGDWQIVGADSATVFQANPYDIWEACLQLVREENRILPHIPNNPEWN